MFWFGKNNHFVGPDWRPEVHDSDGLEMMLASGERIWRPLNNPPRVTANSFVADSLRGFGLAQRERSFEEYQDDGVFYEKRATLWVEPQGDWGAGSVMLVELSTNDEIHDNIVAFWNPAGEAKAGIELRSRLQARTGWRTRRRRPWRASSPRGSASAASPASRGRPTWSNSCSTSTARAWRSSDRSSGVEAVVGASRGTLDLIVAFPIATTTRWRVNFDLDIGPPGPEDDTPIDLRLYLRHDGRGDVGDLDLPGVSDRSSASFWPSTPDRRLGLLSGAFTMFARPTPQSAPWRHDRDRIFA